MANQPKLTPCPRCLPNTLNFITNRQGTFYAFCASSDGKVQGPHKWEETEQLWAEVARAKQQYPEHYAGPEAPPPPDPAIAAGPITIDPATKKLLEELAKQPLRSAADIKGVLFEAVQTAKDLENENKKLIATNSGMSRSLQNIVKGGGATGAAVMPNQAVVTIPEWAEAFVEEMATMSGQTTAEWVAAEFNAWIENYCGAPQRVV